MRLEELLRQGTDGRVGPGQVDGYGCFVRPDSHRYEFGSCTASTTTERGWAAAQSAALWMEEEGPEALALSIRSRLTALLGLPAGVEVVLVPSGTDVEFLAVALVHHQYKRPVCSVLVCEGETGSGTPLAAALCHFSAWPPLRSGARMGTPVGGILARAVEVPCRDPQGELLPETEVRRSLQRAGEEAGQRGEQVLWHHVPCSKTGASSPEPVEGPVLVDAAQGRVSPVQIRSWLQRGWMVSLTASKFWEGPPFCGVLLVSRPPPVVLPPGFGAYFSRLDLPVHWGAENFPAANRGLLLRWAAGLEGW